MLMVVVAAVAALQGPGPGPVTPDQIAEARSALDERLFDYPSARFRDVRGSSVAICGFVNAKNRLGAYSGWKRFAAYSDEDGGSGLYLDDPDDGSDDIMIDAACGEDGLRNQGRDYSTEISHGR